MNNPQHIGVIMDGNRRWAKNNGLNPESGHGRGSEIFGNLCDWCINHGVKYLTVYAFSTENWKRSEIEKRHIFNLLDKFFHDEADNCVQKGIRIKVIGERSRFDHKTLSAIEHIERKTIGCSRLIVQIALSYGGRDEIVRAAKRLASDVSVGKLSLENATEDVFASYLDTTGTPDVDLIIRTGGAENRRLSNFLPWQTVYAELYFSDLLWPDFTEKEFNRALEYFNSVKRKAGK
jgi:undecaprenyl diphosphate synthase